MRASIKARFGSREFRGLPEKFQIRCRDAMAMLRDCSKMSDVIRKHGKLVADEALRELERVDPRWWAR